MLEFYLNHLKKSIRPNSQKTTKIFLELIKNFAIADLITFSNFNEIKDRAIPNLTEKEVFDAVAFPLVRQKNINNIKFLIEECGFDLKQYKDKKSATLLHEACLYGATELVKYLLEKGFSATAQNICGEEPIHQTVKFKNDVQIIALLKQYGANLNAKDENGRAPIHYAAIHQNFTAITALNTHGANLKLKYQNKDYRALSHEVKSGKTRVPSLPILQNDWVPNIESKYYYGVSQTKLNQEIFSEILKQFINSSKALTEQVLLIFADSYVLSLFSPSFNMNLFKQDIVDAINQGKLTLKNALIVILRPALYFSSGNFRTVVLQLVDIALELIDKEESYSADIIQICNAMILYCNQVGAYQKAVDIALKAQRMIADETDKTTRSYLFYNLGRSYEYQWSKKEAEENLRKAFELMKNDRDIFRGHFLTQLENKKYLEASATCQLSECEGDFERVSKIIVNYLAGELSSQEVLQAIETDVLDDVDTQMDILALRVSCYINLKNYDKALAISKDKFDWREDLFESDFHTYYDVNMAIVICNYLSDCMACKDYGRALTFIQNYMEKYSVKFAHDLTLMTYVVMVYIANHRDEEAELVINRIVDINPQFPILSDLYLYLGNAQIDNPTVAIRYFELSLQSDAQNGASKIHKILALLLQNKREELEDFTDNVTEIIENFRDDSSEEETAESLGTEYDPQKIHQYFQRQKQQILSNLTQKLSSNSWQIKIKWKINALSFTEGEANLIALNSDFYPDYYAVIDPQLKMDNKLLEKFQLALEKGICSRRLGQNGIKFLKNTLIELKIDEDIRLCTTVIYKNSHNKYLILFDQMTNHEGIKNLLRKNKELRVIECSECNEEQISIGKFHGSLFANVVSTVNPHGDNNQNHEKQLNS